LSIQAQTIPVSCSKSRSRNFKKVASKRLSSPRVNAWNRQASDSASAPFSTWLLRGLIALILFLSFPAGPLLAAPKVSCEVSVVSRHPALVTLNWGVKVVSEKAWDACDLIISFQDEKGREVHSVRETVALRVGQSSFSGTEVCDSEIWSRVKKYVATLDCLFD
jgi:hypothetical protein